MIDDLLGQRLVAVERMSWRQPGEREDREVGPARMVFESGMGLVLDGKTDFTLAWRVCLPGDDSWLYPHDYEVDGGRWRLRDASDEEPFAAALGSPLTGWEPVYNEVDEVVGLTLIFEWLALPLSLFGGEVTTWQHVQTHRGVGSEVEQELDDRWWLGLRSRALQSVDAQGYMVVLDFGSGSVLTITSAANVRAASAPGTEAPAVTSNEDGTVSASEALMSLTGQRVLSSVGFKTGMLRLVFESGALVTVPHGEQYEAWQLTGPSGRMWVSLPGGGLATFPATSS